MMKLERRLGTVFYIAMQKHTEYIHIIIRDLNH